MYLSRQIIFTIAGLLFALILFCGNFHIITGDGIFVKIIPKQSFAIEETFINVDKIARIPYYMALAKYPISVRALQDNKMIMTDEEIKEQNLKRLKNQFEQNMKDAIEAIERKSPKY